MNADSDLVTRFFEVVLGPEHRTAEATSFLSADFVDHSAAASDAGPEGVARKLDALWEALPDGRYKLLHVVAGDGFVAARSHLLGGLKPVEFADFYRVEGGLIVEHWHVVDTAALAAALTPA